MRDQYDAIYQDFRWHVDAKFNVAQVCCTRWARSSRHKNRTAIILEPLGRHVTYSQLESLANRFANALEALGVSRGQRVAIILPQCLETAVAHIGVYKRAAMAMPMSVLFGPEALVYRLQDSRATVAVVDASVLPALAAARDACPDLKHVIVVGEGNQSGAMAWDALLAQASDRFHQQTTLADEGFNLIYTSGTTGPPKGAVIAHRAMIGNLTGFVASQNWMPKRGDVFWSPADWAWTGGLMDALLPTLYFGLPIVAYSGRFTAETALQICHKHLVTNSFLFPTALKMMMKEWRRADAENLRLRAVMSAGEAVGKSTFEWCQETLGFTVNEMFGQTELNYIVGNSAKCWPAVSGSMGKAYPGHRVAVIDEQGQVVPPGQLGEIAVHRKDIHGVLDPVFFLGYWNNPQATADKFSGEWCRTGDLATPDERGYLWYGGRADDMFKAAGYRIGPSEVESCLVQHPAVMNAAVVPKPDKERGNVIKAFIVLADSFTDRSQASLEQLTQALQTHVRGKLAPYEYPKEIEFIDALPMTTTGKVQRRILRLQEQEKHLSNV